ncbi:MAG TPA: ABC transporter ATP-binding protein [Candidatus Choladocola avistercoris]|nr:ABC transporter ATP-binding protein [Candidatus Choladocola avistercoris]
MQNILEAKDLKKVFYKNRVPFEAVDGVSFHIGKGECLGLAGESGCGKSTIAKIITRLIMPEEGSVRLDGKVQMVFQTPQDSFDPRRTLGDGIMEGMRNQGMGKKQAKERACEMLDLVELDRRFFYRYPHEASGGECQRAAIARALAVEPQLLICDEATSALDVTVQAQIAALLKRLQEENGMSLLLISHDLALVQYLCSRVLIMYQGKIIEEGIPDEVIQNPRESYTRLLVEAIL